MQVGHSPRSQRLHNVEAFDMFWIKIGEINIPANLKYKTLNSQN